MRLPYLHCEAEADADGEAEADGGIDGEGLHPPPPPYNVACSMTSVQRTTRLFLLVKHVELIDSEMTDDSEDTSTGQLVCPTPRDTGPQQARARGTFNHIIKSGTQSLVMLLRRDHTTTLPSPLETRARDWSRSRCCARDS